MRRTDGKRRSTGFVPGNLYSIAEAQFYPEARPYAIYNEVSQMVGFILYGDKLLICYQNANQAARRLYARLGFREQSIDTTGKVTALLTLQQ